MRARVLMPFEHSLDGVRVDLLDPGEEFDCDDELAPALLKDGLIEPVGADDVLAAPVECQMRPARRSTRQGAGAA